MKGRHKRSHIVLFHWYEASRIDKSIETDYRLLFTRGKGSGCWRETASWGVLLRSDGHVSEVTAAQPRNCTKWHCIVNCKMVNFMLRKFHLSALLNKIWVVFLYVRMKWTLRSRWIWAWKGGGRGCCWHPAGELTPQLLQVSMDKTHRCPFLRELPLRKREPLCPSLPPPPPHTWLTGTKASLV